MAKNHITLIGCGKMGSAMLEGWLGDVSLDARFTIIEPDHSHLLGCQRATCVSIKIVLPPLQTMRKPARWLFLRLSHR